MESLTMEGLRILYVASEILFYLRAFDVEAYDAFILQTDSWRKEEAMQEICDALIKKDGSYYAITDFLEKAADGGECILGIDSMKELTGKQAAANVLNDILYLDNPISISAGPPEDF